MKHSQISDPIARPEFSQILLELERHAPPEDQKLFSIGPLNSDPESTIREESEDTAEEGEPFGSDDAVHGVRGGGIKTVSQLKDRWEQLSVGDGTAGPQTKGAAGGACATATACAPPASAVEKLKQRVDQHGYVSQAARAIIAAKGATQLRDSFVLARGANVAQRQNALIRKATGGSIDAEAANGAAGNQQQNGTTTTASPNCSMDSDSATAVAASPVTGPTSSSSSAKNKRVKLGLQQKDASGGSVTSNDEAILEGNS